MAHSRFTVPSQLFFSTPEQRLALARELFFDEGERPSGLVSEAVLQSWYRCVRSGQRTRDRLSVETVSKLRISSALRFSQQLREASASGLDRLEATIAGTPCQVILTNPEGMVIYASRRAQDHGELLMQDIARVGVDLSEHTVGTNAPGIVVQTGQGCIVHGGEHFNNAIRAVHCAAAPIRDIHGQLAGVLDISIERRAFGFDAFALIGTYATMIENNLIARQSQDMLLLAFQVDPQLLGTPQAGFAAIYEDGQLKWLNDTAVRLTGGAVGQSIEDVLGHSLMVLLGLIRKRQPQCVCLPNGLRVWIQAQLRTGDRAGVLWSAEPFQRADTVLPPPVSEESWDAMRPSETPGESVVEASPQQSPILPIPSTLQDSQAEQIARALQACGGKVARAARVLGVSRGLIYRYLNKLKA
ncbi:GAF domain-containing protein [Polaromonas sp. C04]|uniref:GAF domain-containing protein n=1 Tax=Polaromonas sp. C04 TaxID=1945857 RepID=UPI000984B359|nr:GAF domain-containing protein [Polaromonas sp. C04]OOG53220.1 hypothetical protein B0E49_12250 [Polaromonas sp. C04]